MDRRAYELKPQRPYGLPAVALAKAGLSTDPYPKSEILQGMIIILSMKLTTRISWSGISPHEIVPINQDGLISW
jgi:hypothetical protein